jgi:hypothetical protein
MLRYIVIALFGFSLLALAAIWVISGGPRKLATETRESIQSAIAPDDDIGFRLPWQPAEIFPTFDITETLDLDADVSMSDTFAESQEDQLAELEAEYDRLRADASKQRTFGAPSPHAGKIGIMQDVSGVRATNPHQEYVQIAANYSNSESVDITGWTLESALSGTRIQIPPGASTFLAGSANLLGSVKLDPGGLALVASAPSPVGISFRENMCTGYLGQFQSFEPPLSEECPSPSQVMPLTEENLRMYGDTCFDMIANLPQCRFPQNFPDSIYPSCRSFLMNALSYNGCVSENSFRSEFQKNMWRVYLGAQGELWRNSHDAIRLIDAQGRTVSVFVY